MLFYVFLEYASPRTCQGGAKFSFMKRFFPFQSVFFCMQRCNVSFRICHSSQKTPVRVPTCCKIVLSESCCVVLYAVFIFASLEQVFWSCVCVQVNSACSYMHTNMSVNAVTGQAPHVMLFFACLFGCLFGYVVDYWLGSLVNWCVDFWLYI